MSSLPQEQLQRGVVCASAGNHAQGFAYTCKKLECKGVVFMPVITPNQKVNQTKMFGEDFIEIKLVGILLMIVRLLQKNIQKKMK